MDGSGNVFVADTLNSAVKEVLAAGGYTTINTLGSGFHDPSGVAVDGSGNVFVADFRNSAVKEIQASCIAGANNSTCVLTLGSGFNLPAGAAVDGSGNVFVADLLNNAVKEILAAGGYITVKTLGGGFYYPSGVAVDGSGNVFVADGGNNAVEEIVAAGGYTTVNTLGSGFNEAAGVAVDGSGSVFVADTYNSAVRKLDFADPPSLTFIPTPLGPTNTGSPQTVTVLNDGNADLKLSALSYPADFSEATGHANACTGSSSLSTGQECDLPIEFTPQQLGALSEQVVLTDNALNVTGAQQSIAVSGTGIAEVEGATQFSVTPTASSAPVFAGAPFSITVTALNFLGNIANAYSGTVSFTSSDPGFVNPGPLTLASGTGQATVTLPTAGTQTITATDTTTSAVTGSASFSVVASFGSVNVGATSANPVTVTFDTGGTLGSTLAVTQGATGLDFTNAGGGTCAVNTAYSAGETCTMNVTFKPAHPGPRYGGVELLDGSGNLLAMAYVQGTGVGPQVTFADTTTGAYLPSAQSILGSGFSNPFGVAVDASGNVFVADFSNSEVKEILAAGGYTTVNTLGSGFADPWGVAVDGSGNVFVADTGNGAAKEIPASCIAGANNSTCVLTLGSGFLDPKGVAVDGSGNVFVADTDNSAVKEIVAAGGYSTIKTLWASEYSWPEGVAVDGSGNVFFTYGFISGKVNEILAASGYTTVNTLYNGFNNPDGVAADGSGNVFVADSGYCDPACNGAVREIPASCIAGADDASCMLFLGSELYGPVSVAVDGSGNVFVADTSVTKLDYADPPSLTFALTHAGQTSSDSPQTVTVSNNGNADMSFPVPASGNNPSIPANFTLAGSGATACPLVTSGSSQAGTLAAGQSCNLAISSTPASGTNGPTSGSLMLTDNSLNAAAPNYATQSIGLNGTSSDQPPVAALGGAVDSVTFNRTAGQTDSVEVTGWAADPVDGSPMSNVKVYIDGNLAAGTFTMGIYSPLFAAANNNPLYARAEFQFVTSVAALSPGWHTVTAVATDSAGFSATSNAAGFKVAPTAGAGHPVGWPPTAVDNMTGSATVGQGDMVEVTGWAADPQDGSPLTNIAVYIDGILDAGTLTNGLPSPWLATYYSNPAFGQAKFEILSSAAALSSGNHEVKVVATNSLGLSSTFGPVSFTVAASAESGYPVGWPLIVGDNATGSTTVSQGDMVEVIGWAADPQDGSPMANVKVYIDGNLAAGTLTNGKPSPVFATANNNAAYGHARFQFLYPAASLLVGEHWLTVVATDSKGLATTFGPVDFNVVAVPAT